MSDFLDTNVLLYAASSSQEERGKTARARQLLKAQDIALSTQVLQEFYWVATRPHKLALTHVAAQTYIDVWKLFPIQPITLSVVEDALYLCHRFQLSYWDAAIIAAARHLGCTQVLTEDLNHGQDYEGVRVFNPFEGL